MQIVSRASFVKKVMFVDLAVSTKTTADYTAIGIIAVDADVNIYIVDMVRGRWEWPDAKKVIVQTALSHKPQMIGIEQVAFQLAAIQELLRTPDLMGIAIRGVPIEKDKVSRALPWAARAEAGKVFLIRGFWNSAFLDEVCMFPQGTHDDQVDTVSGGVGLVASGRSNSAIGAFGSR